mmetsp:Transcript_14680/g.41569  ORF Transcript_14680/g.41569 Transcript_14680/m.41569 type:complete len:131 (+) Transcript_14680:154-546(+)|eukprot:CAMPEP_0119562614 /NCGR_PEP_ID=MMETSP1352-20130426/21008_1 /TAXON_ID=265584 /ORGANISM="Stauroneis constricta, Strain CCMP1120" /LENGTH=130 /DNA_ID=CAMNT_0007611053 /DNA_START=79 /DNA_END=471 /DNA_ORIENTATION=-
MLNDKMDAATAASTRSERISVGAILREIRMNRALQQENFDLSTDAPTIAPTMSPTVSVDSKSSGPNTFHYLFLVVVFALGGILIWWACSAWKERRERRMMQLTSARADTVLGDMQMVPNDEYEDDDPELL